MPECQGLLTNNMAESESDFFLLVEIKNGPSVFCRKLVEVKSEGVVGKFISELITLWRKTMPDCAWMVSKLTGTKININ